mmetsp:Transcript_76527/g.224622  ORF Transcript_76527/g.224622 Transcript_76527/m.224622 type:complete len:201 (+) Transcript_76527:560-1162(+)
MVSQKAFQREPMLSVGSTKKIRLAKNMVRIISGKSSTGSASSTSLKAFVSRCTFSQRLSNFRDLMTGKKHKSKTVIALLSTCTGCSKTKPIQTRTGRAAAARTSMRFNGRKKKLFGVGFTASLSSTSNKKMLSKVVSITAATMPYRKVSSTICRRQVTTDAMTTSGHRRAYHRAGREDSPSSRKRCMDSAKQLNRRPLEE